MGSLQFPNMGMGLRLAAFGRRSSAKKSNRKPVHHKNSKARWKIFGVTYTECLQQIHFAANCALNSNKAKPNEIVGEEKNEKIIHRACKEQKNIFTTVKFTRSCVQLVQLRVALKLARFEYSPKFNKSSTKGLSSFNVKLDKINSIDQLHRYKFNRDKLAQSQWQPVGR